jgi:recombination protein RecT
VEQERAKWMAILRDKNAADGDVLRAKVGIIETAREQIQNAAPQGVDGKTIVDYAIQLMREDPKILPCTISSLVTAISRAAMCGLRLGGLRPEAHIVPTKVNKKIGPNKFETIRTDANLWPGYHGWIKLVRNTGRMTAEPIVACVYEGEEFSADIVDGVVRCGHKGSALNAARRSGDDSKVTYVWARWFLDSGTVDVVMSREDIQAHARQYSKKPQYGEWNWETKWREMAEKTVLIHSVRRRFVPMQVEAAGLGLLDEDTQEQSPLPAIADSLGVIDGEFSAVEDPEQDESPQIIEDPVKASPQTPPNDKPTTDELVQRYMVEIAHQGTQKEVGDAHDKYLPPDGANPHGFTAEQQKMMVKAFQDRLAEVRSK